VETSEERNFESPEYSHPATDLCHPNRTVDKPDVCDLCVVVVYKQTSIWPGFSFIVPRIYALSLTTSLNHRETLRQMSDSAIQYNLWPMTTTYSGDVVFTKSTTTAISVHVSVESDSQSVSSDSDTDTRTMGRSSASLEKEVVPV
jgi:hypothetical protein